MTDDGNRRRDDYRIARLAIAGTLTVLIVVLSLYDAISSVYHFSEVTLGAFLGTIVTLLGIEAVDLVRGSRK